MRSGILLCLAFAMACASGVEPEGTKPNEYTPPPPTGNVEAKVTVTWDYPSKWRMTGGGGTLNVSGASVRLGTLVAVTDTFGHVAFEGVDTGTYTLSVEKSTYQEHFDDIEKCAPKPVMVIEDDTAEIDIRCEGRMLSMLGATVTKGDVELCRFYEHTTRRGFICLAEDSSLHPYGTRVNGRGNIDSIYVHVPTFQDHAARIRPSADDYFGADISFEHARGGTWKIAIEGASCSFGQYHCLSQAQMRFVHRGFDVAGRRQVNFHMHFLVR